ncbi:MAG: MFS transporter [Candidatus Dormibacteraeota bacterium]|nr:MFS transporter [Candidatus Dormibacteraeota bacterium]
MSRAAPPGSPWRRLFTEPPRPDVIRGLRWAPWLAVGTVCIGAFMGQLDVSIVTVALPTIGRDLHAGLGAVEWVVLSYAIVLVGVVALVGRLADTMGRKLLYTYGFAVFAAASAGCALAPNLGVLVTFRAVQGVGAVMLQANSVALIRDVAPRGRLGTAVGLQGAAQAVGLAAGPSIGGLLVAAGGWRLIFLVNVPVGAAGVVLAWLLLPRSRNLAPPSPIDIPGAALLAGAAALALASLSLAVQPGFSVVAVAITGAGAVVLGAATVARQRARPGSVIDSVLLRRPAFTLGCASGLLSYAALFGTLLVVPFSLESGAGLNARDAGLRLTVLPVALALVAPFGGRIADRAGARLPTVSGMALAAIGLGLVATESGTAALLAGLSLAGAGFGLFIPANNAAVVGSAPPTHAGRAAGLLNLTRGLGTALGVAVAALVYVLAGGVVTQGAVVPGAAAAGARATALVLLVLALAAGALASLRPARVRGGGGP